MPDATAASLPPTPAHYHYMGEGWQRGRPCTSSSRQCHEALRLRLLDLVDPEAAYSAPTNEAPDA